MRSCRKLQPAGPWPEAWAVWCLLLLLLLLLLFLLLLLLLEA